MNATAKPVTGPFEKTKGWLDWFEGPSKPSFSLPRGSVDAHCHVFGPGADFPYAPERKYTPCDASKAQLFALRDRLGFDRNVVVQATCHGADNSAMVDALLSSGGKARGIATVRRDVTDAELKRLHEAGVRGVRFNFVKRLVDFTPQDELLVGYGGAIASFTLNDVDVLRPASADARATANVRGYACYPLVP